MLKKLLILFACTLIFTFFTKCETTANNNEDSTTIGDMKSSTGAKDLDVKKTPLLEVNNTAEKIIEDWTALYILKNEIIKLKEDNTSIFELQKNDIKQLFINLEINMPNLLNTNNIWARIKVLETNAYQFYEASTNHPEGSRRIKETKNNTLRAYDILIHQINKTYEKSTQSVYKIGN